MLPMVNVVRTEATDYLLLSTEDAISKQIYQHGVWGGHLLELSRLFYQAVDAPLILDIGANLGAFAVPMAQAIHQMGGQVYAFEPQRIIYYQLCGNIFLNRLDNVVALNQAVGETDDVIDIPKIQYDKHHNIGAFSLDKTYRERHGIEQFMQSQTDSVAMCRLDSLVLPQKVALIKLDVEGYEINVLKGGQKFLAEQNFPPILFELWGYDWFKEQKQELLDYFKLLGYEVSQIGNDSIAQHPNHPVQLKIWTEGREVKVKRVR